MTSKVVIASYNLESTKALVASNVAVKVSIAAAFSNY